MTIRRMQGDRGSTRPSANALPFIAWTWKGCRECSARYCIFLEALRDISVEKGPELLIHTTLNSLQGLVAPLRMTSFHLECSYDGAKMQLRCSQDRPNVHLPHAFLQPLSTISQSGQQQRHHWTRLLPRLGGLDCRGGNFGQEPRDSLPSELQLNLHFSPDAGCCLLA